MRGQPRRTEAFDALLDRLSERLDPTDAPLRPGGGTIHAAVTLLLRPAAEAVGGDVDGSAEILFIRRAKREGDPWSGHIAFPVGAPRPPTPTCSRSPFARRGGGGHRRPRGGRILGRPPTVEP